MTHHAVAPHPAVCPRASATAAPAARTPRPHLGSGVARRLACTPAVRAGAAATGANAGASPEHARCTAPPSRSGSLRRGFGTLEVVCTLAVVGILASLALPSLQRWITRQALLASAAELEADLQFARAAALARQEVVRLAVQPAGSGNCYMLHTGAPGACRCAGDDGTPHCAAAAAVLRVNAFDPRRVLALSASRDAVAFDPRYGTVTPTTTLRLAEPDGTAIHEVVNVMGRVRTCSPGALVPGYPRC